MPINDDIIIAHLSPKLARAMFGVDAVHAPRVPIYVSVEDVDAIAAQHPTNYLSILDGEARTLDYSDQLYYDDAGHLICGGMDEENLFSLTTVLLVYAKGRIYAKGFFAYDPSDVAGHTLRYVRTLLRSNDERIRDKSLQ